VRLRQLGTVDKNFQRIKGNKLFHAINTQKMRVVLFFQFTFGKDIIDMFSYRKLLADCRECVSK
jgi:hypothetical protein